MAKKSITERITITKKGKVLHRVPGQSHAKVNKSAPQRKRKKEIRGLDIKENRLRELKHE